jgi:putative chitinase
MARRTFASVLAFAALCGAAHAATPARLALVIGNGNYTSTDHLPNAPSDARKLADKLKGFGFKVQTPSMDLDKAGLTAAVSQFVNDLQAAGPNVIGFFYYSGHAAQDEYGINYILPVDATPDTPAQVRAQGIPIQKLLEAMEQSGNDINVVVLDACRNWFDTGLPPPPPAKGLSDMGRNASVLIAYATRAGDTADDNANLDSSPFSRRLLEALDREANEPILMLLDDVKTNVVTDTDSTQLPMISDGLTTSGRWSLTSGDLSQVPDKPQPLGAGTAPSQFLKQLDRKKLMTFFRGHTLLVDTLLARRDILESRQINTPNRLAQFLAAIGYESGGFSVKEEKFGFSAVRLHQIFPNRLTLDAATRIAGKPEQVANVIYANKLGNGPPQSGDGWKFRGRGPFGFFITGRYNYARYGQAIGVDLVNSPDLVNDPDIAFAISAAIWQVSRANEAAENDDLALAAHRYSGVPLGASAGLSQRKIWLAQAKKAVQP